MEQKNEMMITFDSRSSNESFARVAVAAFTTQLNPTLEEVADIKTAVSEAITNAIIHGYDNQVKKIRIRCRSRRLTPRNRTTRLPARLPRSSCEISLKTRQNSGNISKKYTKSSGKRSLEIGRAHV